MEPCGKGEQIERMKIKVALLPPEGPYTVDFVMYRFRSVGRGAILAPGISVGGLLPEELP